MLYKYLGQNRLDVLQDLKIRFTQPCELNDPFESALLVEADFSAAWEAQMQRLVEEADIQSDDGKAMLETIKAKLREEFTQQTTPQIIGREIADS